MELVVCNFVIYLFGFFIIPGTMGPVLRENSPAAGGWDVPLQLGAAPGMLQLLEFIPEPLGIPPAASAAGIGE